MTDAAVYRRRWERERLAREEAETIAERALADLYAANQALDARVQEQTIHLTEALARAHRAAAARDGFLHQLAHRASSPLHIVQGFVELVAQEVGPGRLARTAATAVQATRRLGRSFEGLLELSQIVAGGFDPQPSGTCLADWTDGLLRRWLPDVAAAGRTIIVDPGNALTTPFEVDVHRLDQIIDPLLDNAILHGQGQITVEADLDGETLRCSVADDGDAPAPETIEQMLTPFWSTTDDGFGVGLSLSLIITEGLGGHLHIDPVSTHTCLRFVLPVSPSLRRATDLATVDDAVLRALVAELPVPGLPRRLVDAWTGSLDAHRIALLSGDSDAITRAAHALISGARQLGLHELGAAAAEVERGDTRELRLLVEALDLAPAALHEALERLEADADDGPDQN